MDNSRKTTLVLGGTGRTGSLVARKLAGRGLIARTASRHGADLPFDWDNPGTHGPALAGVDRGAWVDGAIVAGVVPADYGVMLNWLTEMIASGHGSRPNDDVRRVTGSPPASFADFARRSAHAWAVPAAHS